MSQNLSENWKTMLIISIKAVTTALLVAAMIYSPTYFAAETMKNNYAWIWGGLILFAIWTKRNRPIVKSIASLGPALGVWGILQFLFEMPEGGWPIFLALIALCALIILAIWLKLPSKDSPSNANTEYDEQVSQKNLKGLSGWLLLWVYWQLSSIILTLSEPYNILKEYFGFYAIIFLVINAYILYLFFGKKKGFPIFVISYLCVFSLSELLLSYSEYFSILASLGKIIPIIIWIPYFLKSKRVKVTFVEDGWFPYTSDKVNPVSEVIDQPEVTDIGVSNNPPIIEKSNNSDNQKFESANVICTNCQFSISKDFDFCPKCGQSISILKCENCQTELKRYFDYCPHCGNKLG